MSVEAYPLQWPQAWERTKLRRSAVFKVDMGKAVSELYEQLEALGAKDIVLSSNLMVRLDGRPLSKQRSTEDPGVAVYFNLDGEAQCIPCDKWINVKDNIRAVGLTVEALRGLERWGAKDMVRAAFSGFKALPGGSGSSVTPINRSWWDILEFDSDEAWNETIIRSRYKDLSKRYHPDNSVTGDAKKFLEIKAAMEQGLRSL